MSINSIGNSNGPVPREPINQNSVQQNQQKQPLNKRLEAIRDQMKNPVTETLGSSRKLKAVRMLKQRGRTPLKTTSPKSSAQHRTKNRFHPLHATNNKATEEKKSPASNNKKILNAKQTSATTEKLEISTDKADLQKTADKIINLVQKSFIEQPFECITKLNSFIDDFYKSYESQASDNELSSSDDDLSPSSPSSDESDECKEPPKEEWKETIQQFRQSEYEKAKSKANLKKASAAGSFSKDSLKDVKNLQQLLAKLNIKPKHIVSKKRDKKDLQKSFSKYKELITNVQSQFNRQIIQNNKEHIEQTADKIVKLMENDFIKDPLSCKDRLKDTIQQLHQKFDSQKCSFNNNFENLLNEIESKNINNHTLSSDLKKADNVDSQENNSVFYTLAKNVQKYMKSATTKEGQRNLRMEAKAKLRQREPGLDTQTYYKQKIAELERKNNNTSEPDNIGAALLSITGGDTDSALKETINHVKKTAGEKKEFRSKLMSDLKTREANRKAENWHKNTKLAGSTYQEKVRQLKRRLAKQQENSNKPDSK